MIHGAVLWLVPADLVRSLGDTDRGAIGAASVSFASHDPIHVVAIARESIPSADGAPTGADDLAHPPDLPDVAEPPPEPRPEPADTPLQTPPEVTGPSERSEGPAARAAWERLDGTRSSAARPALSSVTESGGQGDATRPVVVALPAAHYPEASRSRGVVVVEVRVRVDADGRVSDAEIPDDAVAVPDEFRAPALAVASRARFEPARRGGRPHAAWTSIRVVFDPD